ncbi:MAG: hypothetical protein WB767_02195 [Nocardioides sp.]
MKRTTHVVIALLTLLGLLVSGQSAAAAPNDEYEQYEKDYWFGTIAVSHELIGGDAFFTTFEIENPEQAYPLPFHSFLTADLYDCEGRKAYSVYGTMQTVQEPGRPWMSTSSVSLNLPPRGGPYAAWVVMVRSKGRAAETFTITDGGPGFTLACDGKYRRNKQTFWEPRFDAARPPNAAFNKPIKAVLGQHVRSFGRPTGVAKVGSAVNLAGAKDRSGKPNCGLNVRIDWPQRPTLEPSISGSSCGPYGYRIDAESYFRKRRADGSYQTVRAPSRGKRLTLASNFFVRGHNYVKEFDFGVIK